MIPKKSTPKINARVKKFIKSLPSINKSRLSKKAAMNAEKKFGFWGVTRAVEARMLKKYRAFDASKGWGISFNASLKDTSKALGMDLASFIKKNFPRGKVLEFGCGSGRTISQLQRAVPTASFSALGLRVIPEWAKHSNYKKIDWHVAHADNLRLLKKSIPPKSLDFVFSSLGIAHSKNIMHTLSEIGSLMKKDGILAVNFEASSLIDLKELSKNGFSVVKQTFASVRADKDLSAASYSSTFPLYVLLLKKL